MRNEDAIKWLENLKQDIGSLRHENLWPYAQAIDEVIDMLEEQEALEKRNEPVKVRHLHNAKVTMHEEVTFTDECGNCGGYLMKNWKACP